MKFILLLKNGEKDEDDFIVQRIIIYFLLILSWGCKLYQMFQWTKIEQKCAIVWFASLQSLYYTLTLDPTS